MFGWREAALIVYGTVIAAAAIAVAVAAGTLQFIGGR